MKKDELIAGLEKMLDIFDDYLRELEWDFRIAGWEGKDTDELKKKIDYYEDCYEVVDKCELIVRRHGDKL